MHPIFFVAAIGGFIYWADKRRRVPTTPSSPQPSIGQSPYGFVVTEDCSRFIVTDPVQLEATVASFYREQKLAHLQPHDPVEDVPGAITQNFFAKYAVHCPKGDFEKWTDLPLSRRLMVLYVFLAMLAEATKDGLITEFTAAQQAAKALTDLLDQATAEDWNSVFQGTVPPLEELLPSA